MTDKKEGASRRDFLKLAGTAAPAAVAVAAGGATTSRSTAGGSFVRDDARYRSHARLLRKHPFLGSFHGPVFVQKKDDNKAAHKSSSGKTG